MAKRRNNGLTKSQLDELEKALRAKADMLRARRVDLAEERVFEIEPDPMDSATDATAGHEDAALSAHDTYLLGEIESALTRMAEGRYGVSEASGEPIPIARLRIIPWARRNAEEEEEASHAAR